VKYAWIKTQSGHSLRTLCAVLDVSSSGYYAWLRRKPSARAGEGVRLLQQIELIHHKNT
jgi:putative transposase